MDVLREIEKDDVLEYQVGLNNDANRRASTASRELRRIEDIVHLKHISPAAKRVLCIGARDDSEVETFLNAGYSVSAIDVCTQTGLIQRKDMADLNPEYYGTYDIVYCSHVLEHVMDPGKTLNAINSVSKDLIFIILPIVNREPDIEHPTVYEIMKHGPETKFKDFPEAWKDFKPLQPFSVEYSCYRNGLTEEYEVALILRLR